MADSYYESQHKGNEIDEQITYVKNVVRDKIGNHETRIEKLEADALYADSTWNVPDLVKFKGAIELDSDTYTTAKLNAKNASLFDTLESPLRGMYWYYVKAKTLDGYTQDSSGNPVQSPYYMPWGILIDVPYPFDGENIEQAEQKEGNPNVIPTPVIDDGSSYTRLQRLELMTSPTSEKRRIFVRRLVRTPDILGNYGEPEWEEWKKADAELATKKYVDSKISAEKVSVVDSLADESSDKALSANQGKILNEKITDIISNELQIGAEDGKFSAGGANANDGGVAIGNDAGTESGVSINENATTRSGVAIGKDAYSYSGVAIGNGAKTLDSEPGGTAIGTNAKSADGGFAGGKNAKAIYSLTEGQTGETPTEETPLDAIQLGEGTNNTPKTFQVYDHQMMDSDGNIPFDRLTNSKSYTDDIFSLAAEKAKAIPHTTAEGQSVKITDQLAGEEPISCKVYGASDGVGDLDSTTGKHAVPIRIFGKNMLKIISGYSTNGGSLTSTKIIKDSKGIIAIAKVVPNSKYTYTSSKSAYDERYFFFENNPIDTSEVAVGGVYGPVRKPYIITIPDNVNYIVFRVTADGVNITENLQLEEGETATQYEPYQTPQIITAMLDTPLSDGEYIDIVSKKRNDETDITISGSITLFDGTNNIMCQTAVQPSRISAEYYQDINKVITEIKNAVLSQGGNV